MTAAIPILTGVGFFTISSISTTSFFVFYAVSLVILVVALAKCVHLLAPKWLTYPDAGKLLQENDAEPLSFNIFQVAATWEDCIKGNYVKLNALFSGLKLTIRLTIIGLIGLIFAFLSLGIESYLIPYVSQKEPFMNWLKIDDWRAVFLGICLLVFALIIAYILIITTDKKKASIDGVSGTDCNSAQNEVTNLEHANKIEELIKRLEQIQNSSERNRLLGKLDGLYTLLITLSTFIIGLIITQREIIAINVLISFPLIGIVFCMVSSFIIGLKGMLNDSMEYRTLSYSLLLTLPLWYLATVILVIVSPSLSPQLYQAVAAVVIIVLSVATILLTKTFSQRFERKNPLLFTNGVNVWKKIALKATVIVIVVYMLAFVVTLVIFFMFFSPSI